MEMEKADIVFRRRLIPDLSELFITNREHVIFRAKLTHGIKKGQTCKIYLIVIPPIWAGINETLSFWIKDLSYSPRPDKILTTPQKEAGLDCELVVRAGPVERFSIYSRPMPDPDGKVRTCLVPEDRFGNPSEFENPVKIRLEWEDKTWTQDIRKSTIIYLPVPKNTARLKAAISMNSLSSLENIANGLREKEELIVIGNPVWVAPVKGFRAAFGEIHWHTEISVDGQRHIDEALCCARDYLNMDFAAPGDHNPSGEKWQQTVISLDRFNKPDDFVTFYGWENGSKHGHENYYFIDSEHPLVCGGKAGFKGGQPNEIVDQLKQYKDFIAIPHHTNAVAGLGKTEDDRPWYSYRWSEPVEYIRLIEIMQLRGNQERNDYQDAWRGWHQNNFASAQDALARGYKIGFVGGTDNHCGWPGRAFAKSEIRRWGADYNPKSVILTGLWAKRVERQSVYDALHARHTWAVWDTRAIVFFTINNVLMGGELEARKGEELIAHIRLSAEDALQSVEIVSERTTVWISSFSEPDIEIDIALGEADKSTHFYLRALQRNGGIIYASPVFISITKQ